MSKGDLNWIANYIWGIADDVLRDLYVRGKYRDVILPFFCRVLRGGAGRRWGSAWRHRRGRHRIGGDRRSGWAAT